MLLPLFAAGFALAGALPDTAPPVPWDSSAHDSALVAVAIVPIRIDPRLLPQFDDTVPRRRRAPVVEYSDWYSRRLTIHRWASWAMLPIFAGQYAAGDQLLRKGSDAPAWARNGHRALATATAGLFGLNTITGIWNLWEGRADPSGRKWRMAHSILMLAADAGFTATGLLADEAEESGDRRTLHRNVAEGSMGVAMVGWLMMLPPIRRE